MVIGRVRDASASVMPRSERIPSHDSDHAVQSRSNVTRSMDIIRLLRLSPPLPRRCLVLAICLVGSVASLRAQDTPVLLLRLPALSLHAGLFGVNAMHVGVGVRPLSRFGFDATFGIVTKKFLSTTVELRRYGLSAHWQYVRKEPFVLTASTVYGRGPTTPHEYTGALSWGYWTMGKSSFFAFARGGIYARHTTDVESGARWNVGVNIEIGGGFVLIH